MTSFQKVVKYFAIALAACLIVGIVGGIYRIGSFFFDNDGVSDESKTYSLSQNITDIKVEITGADLTVTSGSKFSVESNLKHLKVEEKKRHADFDRNRKIQKLQRCDTKALNSTGYLV